MSLEQIDSQYWAVIHFGLIFLVTGVQLAIVYKLSDSSRPPEGLGLYTVYFMASLLGWISYTLQRLADVPMALDVPSVAAVINGYLLLIAAGQRARSSLARLPLGAICLGACLSVFFLQRDDMFVVQNGAAALFYSAAAFHSFLRARRTDNVGDSIGAIAGVIMLLGASVAIYRLLGAGDVAGAHAVALGAQSWAFVFVCIGFLASVLVEYQQHLSHLATEDPLTRLHNRRGLESALGLTLAQAARQQSPTSAILVDIDRFKEINDNFGHEAGDHVLRQVALQLKRHSRASDVVARTDGEEFLLILPQTTLDAARAVAERICQAVGDQPMVINSHRIPVTVSIGVASEVGDVALDRLAQQADRALHLAKRGGSNRVASVESRPIRLSSFSGDA